MANPLADLFAQYGGNLTPEEQERFKRLAGIAAPAPPMLAPAPPEPAAPAFAIPAVPQGPTMAELTGAPAPTTPYYLAGDPLAPTTQPIPSPARGPLLSPPAPGVPPPPPQIPPGAEGAPGEVGQTALQALRDLFAWGNESVAPVTTGGGEFLKDPDYNEPLYDPWTGEPRVPFQLNPQAAGEALYGPEKPGEGAALGMGRGAIEGLAGTISGFGSRTNLGLTALGAGGAAAARTAAARSAALPGILEEAALAVRAAQATQAPEALLAAEQAAARAAEAQRAIDAAIAATKAAKRVEQAAGAGFTGTGTARFIEAKTPEEKALALAEAAGGLAMVGGAGHATRKLKRAQSPAEIQAVLSEIGGVQDRQPPAERTVTQAQLDEAVASLKNQLGRGETGAATPLREASGLAPAEVVELQTLRRLRNERTPEQDARLVELESRESAESRRKPAPPAPEPLSPEAQAVMARRTEDAARARLQRHGAVLDAPGGEGLQFVPATGADRGTLTVRAVPEIRAKGSGAAAHGVAEGAEAVGATRMAGRDASIRLRAGEGWETLGHEEGHASLASGRLTAHEELALRERFGEEARRQGRDWEELAMEEAGRQVQAHEQAVAAGVTPAGPPVEPWAMRLWRGFSPTAEGALGRVATGDVYRPPSLPERIGAGARQFLDPAPEFTASARLAGQEAGARAAGAAEAYARKRDEPPAVRIKQDAFDWTSVEAPGAAAWAHQRSAFATRAEAAAWAEENLAVPYRIAQQQTQEGSFWRVLTKDDPEAGRLKAFRKYGPNLDLIAEEMAQRGWVFDFSEAGNPRVTDRSGNPVSVVAALREARLQRSPSRKVLSELDLLTRSFDPEMARAMDDINRALMEVDGSDQGRYRESAIRGWLSSALTPERNVDISALDAAFERSLGDARTGASPRMEEDRAVQAHLRATLDGLPRDASQAIAEVPLEVRKRGVPAVLDWLTDRSYESPAAPWEQGADASPWTPPMMTDEKFARRKPTDYGDVAAAEGRRYPIMFQGDSASKGIAPFAEAGQPAPTIKANSRVNETTGEYGASRSPARVLVGPNDVRRMDARSLARLQGIPDEYPLPPNEGLARTIIGNGVPPPVMRAVAGPLLRDGDRGVTLFSGGGIAEVGLKDRVRFIGAVEKDTAIGAQYRKAHGDHVIVGDVQGVDFSKWAGADYLHASPVCKQYSGANMAGGETPLDLSTAQATARAIREIRPRVVTVENVKGYQKSDAFRTITKELDRQGYRWDAQVYDAADYGVPQHRDRLLLRAVREGELPPPPPKQAPVGWEGAIEGRDLPKDRLAPWQVERARERGVLAQPKTFDGKPVPENLAPAAPIRESETHAVLAPPAPPPKPGPRGGTFATAAEATERYSVHNYREWQRKARDWMKEQGYIGAATKITSDYIQSGGRHTAANPAIVEEVVKLIGENPLTSKTDVKWDRSLTRQILARLNEKTGPVPEPTWPGAPEPRRELQPLKRDVKRLAAEDEKFAMTGRWDGEVKKDSRDRWYRVNRSGEWSRTTYASKEDAVAGRPAPAAPEPATTMYRGVKRDPIPGWNDAETRYGPGRYFADSRSVARGYTEYGGEVIERPITPSKRFDNRNLDMAAPEFDRLLEVLSERWGLKPEDVIRRAHFTSSRWNDPYADISEMIAAAAAKKKVEIKSGTYELNQALRAAGYEQVYGEVRDQSYAPNHDEVAILDEGPKPGDEKYAVRPEGEAPRDDIDLIADAIRRLDRGAGVPMSDLRAALAKDLPGDWFDRTYMGGMDEGRLQGTRSSWPARKGGAGLEGAIADGEERIITAHLPRETAAPPAGAADTSSVIDAVRSQLSPDLLKREYVEANKTNKTLGHCYAAAEAAYHLLGGQDSPWIPTRGKDPNGVTHWWLRNKETGAILDPTADQYTSVGQKPPYDAGRGAGFLTREPSARAREIIRRVEESGGAEGEKYATRGGGYPHAERTRARWERDDLSPEDRAWLESKGLLTADDSFSGLNRGHALWRAKQNYTSPPTSVEARGTDWEGTRTPFARTAERMREADDRAARIDAPGGVRPEIPNERYATTPLGRAVNPAMGERGELRKIGGVGPQIEDLIVRSQDDARSFGSELVRSILPAENALRRSLGRASFERAFAQQVVPYLEGQRPNLPAGPVRDYADRIRAALDRVATAADAEGVFTGYRQDYFPHVSPEGRWDWETRIDHVVQSHPGWTPEQAEAYLNTQGRVHGTRADMNLERERTGALRDYRTDPGVLHEYLIAASKRIAQARHLGSQWQTMRGLIGQIANQTDADFARATAERALGADLGAGSGRLNRTVPVRIADTFRAANAVLDLSLTGPFNQLPSLSQTFGEGGLRRTARNLVRVMRDPEAARIAATSAIWDNLSRTLIDVTFGGQGANALERGAQTMMRGVSEVDAWQRVIAYHTGRDLVQELHSRAQNAPGGPEARDLRRLGVDPTQPLTPRALDMGAAKFSDRTQYTTRAQDLPLWFTSPMGKVMTQYIPFTYRMHDYIFRELGPRALRGDGRAQAALGRIMLTMIPLGYAALQGAATVKGTVFKQEDFKGIQDWETALRTTPIDVWKAPIPAVVQAATRAGLLAMAQPLMEIFAHGTGRESLPSRIGTLVAGRAGQRGGELLETVQKAAEAGEKEGWRGAVREVAGGYLAQTLPQYGRQAQREFYSAPDKDPSASPGWVGRTKDWAEGKTSFSDPNKPLAIADVPRERKQAQKLRDLTREGELREEEFADEDVERVKRKVTLDQKVRSAEKAVEKKKLEVALARELKRTPQNEDRINEILSEAAGKGIRLDRRKYRVTGEE